MACLPRYELSNMQHIDGEGMASRLQSDHRYQISLATSQTGLCATSDAGRFCASQQAETLGTRMSRRIYLQDLQDHSFLLR